MGVRNFSNFVLSLIIIYSLLVASSTLYNIFVQFSVALVAIRLAEWLMTNTRKYILYQRVPSRNKAVFITGCDSGFGHLFAKRVDKLGFQVFAACLNPEGDGAKDLRNTCSSNLQVLPLDVTSDESVEDAKEFVTKNLGENDLWALVNNAGLTQPGETDWLPLNSFTKVHEVNTFGVVRVTKAFLPLLKKAKGRVVNVTSICARFTCPGFVGYCMSKSAALAFTTGLRVEMMKWGVRAISIEPFFYKTPLTQEQTTLGMIEKSWEKVDPELQSVYGGAYIEAFKRSCSNVLNLSHHKVHEVLDCLEDAVAAQEPLSTYFPCYLPHKVALKLLFVLPKIVTEIYQAASLAEGIKPASLKNNARAKVNLVGT